MLALFFAFLTHAQAESFTPLNLKFDHDTYMSVDLQPAPFAPYLKVAETKNGGVLRTRGESHMTIVTPPEYVKLTKDQKAAILAALKALDWSKTQVKAICLGRGQAVLVNQVESAYFIVVEAPEIKAIRERYQLGPFFPHVTVGYTKRDLHFEDGVKKDTSACKGISTPAD